MEHRASIRRERPRATIMEERDARWATTSPPPDYNFDAIRQSRADADVGQPELQRVQRGSPLVTDHPKSWLLTRDSRAVHLDDGAIPQAVSSFPRSPVALRPHRGDDGVLLCVPRGRLDCRSQPSSRAGCVAGWFWRPRKDDVGRRRMRASRSASPGTRPGPRRSRGGEWRC